MGKMDRKPCVITFLNARMLLYRDYELTAILFQDFQQDALNFSMEDLAIEGYEGETGLSVQQAGEMVLNALCDYLRLEGFEIE